MGNIIVERTRLKSCSKYLISYILSNTLFTPVITPIVVTPVTHRSTLLNHFRLPRLGLTFSLSELLPFFVLQHSTYGVGWQPVAMVTSLPTNVRRSGRSRTRTCRPPRARGLWWYRGAPAAPPGPISGVLTWCRWRRLAWYPLVLQSQVVVSTLLSIWPSWPSRPPPRSPRPHYVTS